MAESLSTPVSTTTTTSLTPSSNSTTTNKTENGFHQLNVTSKCFFFGFRIK